MPYTIDPSSADCYPCTSVLINKFDLRSQQELDRVEAVLVTAKAAQWEESPLCSTFDFEHYKAIHRHLFCDLYEWAGVPRSINISKKGTQFCPADEIPRVSSAIFRRLAEQNFFQSLSFDDFVDAFVDFYIRTNELHPFREGNGRTQRVFLAQLAQHAGYQLDFSCIDPDELMVATSGRRRAWILCCASFSVKCFRLWQINPRFFPHPAPPAGGHPPHTPA